MLGTVPGALTYHHQSLTKYPKDRHNTNEALPCSGQNLYTMGSDVTKWEGVEDTTVDLVPTLSEWLNVLLTRFYVYLR